MWKFLRVDITDINPSVPRETFSETELDNLANLIIEMGGIIRPAILKKADNKKVDERYNIISGDLEYYASVIANQKVPDIEMINAFVVDKEAENIALQQMKLLSPSPALITTPEKTDNPLELRMSNLEKRLETQLQAIREEYQKEIKRLEEKIIISPPSHPSPPSKSILELLNSCDANQLKKVGIPPASVNDFLKKRSEKPFDSLEDILNRPVSGVKEKRLIKLVDYLLTSN
ncbi:MAG: chromosome partitioning protein ParB [Microcystis panniformis Mp_MB_F_20051200_S9]|uniref:Chromosome partitioning protein ParB n=1 Tax=Microcystis panniformis Mp_MB_F_20051200_S9 TaxID=2486223 RepID=A0A552Q1D6_9CHRO|nr:MAG: chromosome partitioning protein ParB [Microcystis panniformis Mp_GB_SS_20050300_S99]TRV49286.1 MAG: chromosome partitioning protein ParB [Microcystis panniformis Mp_MB_F_20080800_S26D]TRV54742.1 MAG: chromosome partitioning protein ParB [Microcystis panniformis Mp_GB_SS_20050300_S99D]TRV60877.1 MAG: chromosome partitioning protein ParB [Microcystis panniformis Mp_MB_F_20051200_S9D]TRV62042.1 MAG: chromosome partitioning protein ParB [Microcystis panniformis Mp_MB_F_20080800_S26]TRV6302